MRGEQNGADDRGDNRHNDYGEPESGVRRGAQARRASRHPFIIYRAARGFQRTRRDPRENPEPLGRRSATIATVRKRVLIVDDHQPFRAVARELLEGAGYVVAGEAADATDALAAVMAEAPDVVLLDVQLPDGDGFALAAALAAVNGPAVVLISSREADDYGQRLATCGARGFIPKSKLSAAAFAALIA
jgi:CheY-like chemotaxis protein